MNTHLYFVYTLKCGEELIHKEIIKVKPIKAGIVTDDKHIFSGYQSIIFRLRSEILNILYARDSMSFDSRVRPIRERIEETKKKGEIDLTILDIGNPEEQYKQQMDTRDKSLGYLLDDSIFISYKDKT